ncbi:MAG: DUF169 domain-containing protein [Methanoregula sp.]|jgi:uncharacterized protein (DUF169 family)
MDLTLRDRFAALWQKYFPGSDLPLALEFRDGPGTAEKVLPPGVWRCIVCQLAKAKNGTPLAFENSSITCAGGRRYSGYSPELPDNFRYFLSSGKPGVVQGERHKQNPEIVDAWEKTIPAFPPHKSYLVFTRWDKLAADDNPEVVIFFARPDVLSGLFTLANFNRGDANGVICPMGAGCSTILLYPWLEQQKDDPKVVLGMFDPSARKCVPPDILTLAFPMKKFETIIGYMEESFLITKDWETVRKKIAMSAVLHQK